VFIIVGILFYGYNLSIEFFYICFVKMFEKHWQFCQFNGNNFNLILETLSIFYLPESNNMKISFHCFYHAGNNNFDKFWEVFGKNCLPYDFLDTKLGLWDIS
jgi:hypothetical protein